MLSRLEWKKLERLKAPRIFTGPEIGSVIAEYLNRRDLAGNDPVRGLAEVINHPLVRAQEIHDYINEAQEKFPFLLFERRPRMHQGAVTMEDSPHDIGRELTPAENRMVLAWGKFHTLINRGIAWRIRKCAKPDCGRWFYAQYRHARYHEDACRIAVETANPEYKKYRADYMRQRREEGKS